MREKRWLLLALYGILLANAVSAAVKATRPKFKIATSSTTTTTSSPTSTTGESDVHENENEDAEATTTIAAETNGTTGHVLTGIPQIDYIWDPNLPRELNGYNLTDYPFYNSIPEDIDFKCDGLHDGFYASVPHKCQVYHHCLFGTRYDFLCANFTAFDQKTFICHFVSEVDCANSKKYWHRNDALYKAATTSTTSTSTTTTPAPVTAVTGRAPPRDRDTPRRRRPSRRRPAYDYYDEEYYDDDYSRPRGYSRDDYEYDDRKYRRDRDRDFRDRDRDFRDRDAPRSRDGATRDDRDRDANVRDRYPSRNNRRDPTRSRDPLEEDTRVRGRDPDQGSRPASREADDTELDNRRTEFRSRDTDDRRYSDKRYRDEYEDKEPVPASAGIVAGSDGYVKPAAPAASVASVYSRPRAPPKIRRPVPLSEQDKYAYKATASQSTEEPRRRPVDVAEDDYYEDELEDLRPVRRPLRRRPSYRDRDRDFYDIRDRERDRPFRSRYRDDEDDLRPRKHSDRSRDRYYDRDRDRGRDRSLDRSKERNADRPVDRDRVRIQDADKQERPYHKDIDRPRTGSRSKDLQDSMDTSPRRANNYDRTERISTTTTTTTCLPEQLVRKPETSSKEPTNERQTLTERTPKSGQSHTTRAPIDIGESHRTNQQPDYQERDQGEKREQSHYQTASLEEYSQEYYDEPEDPPSPPPRTAVRIVKRPFLPSRGGNPNPRGLSPVGVKASAPNRDEDKMTERTTVQERGKNYYAHEAAQEDLREPNEEHNVQQQGKENYSAYKGVGTESRHEHRPDEYDTTIARPATRRPSDRQREEDTPKSVDDAITFMKESKPGQLEVRQNYGEGLAKWPAEQFSNTAQNNEGNVQIQSSSLRNKGRLITSESPNVYGSTLKNEETHDHPTGPQSFRVKQRINEVTHRLQDIPESEYDVTLNDALTPTLNQEANLPSGFVLPLHRQLGRDAILQSSENNYKVSEPVNHQQQKPFVPSPQFLPTINNNDRLRTVYYRTPETIQISGEQYRPQRGSWHDYTGY